MNNVELLLSVPSAAVKATETRDLYDKPCFVASDPPGRQLGSGGGTAHLLHAAWQSSGKAGFGEWLMGERKLLIHGSGQSRRLPGYAAEGKLMLPLPTLPHITGQRPDQTLLNLQWADYSRLFRHAPDIYRVMVTCGDVLVRSPHWIPAYPEADVLILGLQASAEEAANHGVLFSCPGADDRLDFFLQKPSVKKIMELSANHAFSLDTGIWLLSARATDVLMRKCGWNSEEEIFRDGAVGHFDMFYKMGPALGDRPAEFDAEVNVLSCAVMPVPDGRFYHFGSNRSIFNSLQQLSHPAEHRRAFGHAAGSNGLTHVVLHAEVGAGLPESELPVWIENSTVPSSWILSGDNVLTGIPENDWNLCLPRGACLDVLKLQDRAGMVLRSYGFDDVFKGSLDDGNTCWFGRPVTDWFRERGLSLEEAGLEGGCDLQDAAIFPLMGEVKDCGALIQWMVAENPEPDAGLSGRWLEAERFSATDLVRHADIRDRGVQRRQLMLKGFAGLAPDRWRDLAERLDLECCANLLRESGLEPPVEDDNAAPSLPGMHLAMLRARTAGESAQEERAFEIMRAVVTGEHSFRNTQPRRNVLEDQIIWGRSPARLDLAGGWSDTPPYCLEHGGHVVNVAANLNGQPPIQVFARLSEKPVLVLHSIDLGMSETLESYEDLLQPSPLGGFSVARAALRLAGFDPAFHADGGASSLREQLVREFDGGVELSMLAAIPKGSGLGTSSILAGTLLGVLAELCGLGWSQNDLYARTSALEQMLTTGGGWQDQIGGLSPGLKLIETQPGLSQTPEIRWLPDRIFREGAASGRVLLYYTGLTRMARNILSEIVRGIFLNDRKRIALVEEIASTAHFAADRIQRQDWDGLCETIRRSWRLNQELDAGTNPPGVQTILSRIERWSPAVKLLGAGGGGYLLILAQDQKSAAAIRETLRADPPNPRARFVELSISDTGLQITRS